jgi:hypothetical protein
MQIMTNSGWIYNGIIYELPADVTHKELYGFVYEIRNLDTDKKYIGKKLFWSMKTRQVKKKKKRKRVESDWKSYYGSSKLLCEDIALMGAERFQRTILYLCKSKSECSYLELKEQINRDVLLRDDYYNRWVQVKVRKDHIKGLHKNENML